MSIYFCISLPRDMVKVAADSKDYSVSDTVNSEDYTIVKTEGDTAYIALDFLQKYANFDYEVYKRSGKSRDHQ